MYIQGGDDYFLAPRLTEYVVKLTAEVTKAVNQAIGTHLTQCIGKSTPPQDRQLVVYHN